MRRNNKEAKRLFEALAGHEHQSVEATPSTAGLSSAPKLTNSAANRTTASNSSKSTSTKKRSAESKRLAGVRFLGIDMQAVSAAMDAEEALASNSNNSSSSRGGGGRLRLHSSMIYFLMARPRLTHAL